MLLDESEDMFTQDAWLGMKKYVVLCRCRVMLLSSNAHDACTGLNHPCKFVMTAKIGSLVFALRLDSCLQTDGVRSVCRYSL